MILTIVYTHTFFWTAFLTTRILTCRKKKNLFLVNKWLYARSSEHMEWKPFSFFSFSKQSNVSQSDSNIICTSTKKKQICQVWRVLLKKCARHALQNLKWSRAWQPHFLGYAFQIWWKVEILWVQTLVKIWCWYHKPLLSN